MKRTSTTLLREYLESLLLERDVTKQYAVALRYRVDLYSMWLGHQATLEDLDPEVFNRWILTLQEKGYKPGTVKHYRDSILLVWRDAWEAGVAEQAPQRIRRIKVPQQTVHAWTLEEIRKLVHAIVVLRGYVPETRIPKRDWMRGFVFTAYCTGLRRCDTMQWAKWIDIGADDVLTVCQRKTGYVVSRKLSTQAMDALRLLPRECDGTANAYLLPWPGDVRRFYDSFGVMVKAAGIRQGGPKMLRRSAGSQCEKRGRGRGSEFLGHRDPSMFDRSYHDRSISAQIPEPPPDI